MIVIIKPMNTCKNLQLVSAILKKELPHNSARMKTILACLLVLATSVPQFNASCFQQPSKPSDSEIAGKNYMTPVNYDKEKCVRIFMKETCVYKVVEKNDHSKECPVRERVG
ncbi:beta-microseminoprotein-like [Leptosomus discolor]